jgi:hypothetical protein
MNPKYLLQTAIFRALPLAAIGLSASIGSSWAASISFVPAGSQLDGDPINDIATEVGEMISFDVLLDTTGLGSTGSLDISYGFTWDSGRFLNDPGELEIKPINDDVDFGEADNIVCAISFAICSVSYSGLPLNQQGTLTTIAFNVFPELINDGASDFDIQIGSATIGGVDFTSEFSPSSQEVEVQVPEPLTILGTATAAGFGAFFKRELKKNKKKKDNDK